MNPDTFRTLSIVPTTCCAVPSKWKPLRECLLIFAAYLLLALLFTYPLLFQFTSHIPGVGGDAYQFYWNVWWTRHALVDLHASPYFTHLLFHPSGVSLTHHTLSLMNGLIALIPGLLFNTTIVFNSLVLFILALAGVTMRLLCLHLGADPRAAFLGGILFAFSPFRMTRIDAHLNILSLHFIPCSCSFSSNHSRHPVKTGNGFSPVVRHSPRPP